MEIDMKAVLGALALLSFTATASADWEMVGYSDQFLTYAYISSIRTKGHMVKMWVLYDYFEAPKASGGEPYLSVKAQREFDCDGERSRGIYSSLHSKQMGGGDVVSASENLSGEFHPVAPDSIGRTLWAAACAHITHGLPPGFVLDAPKRKNRGKLTKVNG